ncbi:methyltransferase domain-containing protein [Longimicrobium sp.]|uniref:methyltransferase domain-containing protein n=1 Tax=Longimicrobium sp. TaxID=2029185 RepID=UPI003B3B58AB
MTHGTGYVDPAYLDAAARLAAEGKRRSYERLRLSAGASVLDVGCGPGTDTLPLAEIVGPSGHVAGIDRDPEMVAEADRRARAAGVDRRVEHRVGDATALPFADGAFDGVRSERLLLHLAEPERAVAEMVRVTRPGGWVVLVDTDWGTRSVDTPETELERRMAHVLAELCLANGYSGRRLYGMAKRAGLADVTPEALPLYVTDYALWRLLSRLDVAGEEAVRAGVMTADEVRRLDESWRALGEAGTFFALTTLVLVSGRRE